MRRLQITFSLAGIAFAGVCLAVATASLDAATPATASATTASPPPAASSVMPWPTARPDRLATCADVLVLKPLEGRTYLFVADARAQTVAFIDAIFFTQRRSYEITFPALRIDRPSEASKGAFRSAAIVIEAPRDERILGASLSSIGTSCGAAHAAVPSVAGVAPQPSLSQVISRLDVDISVDRLPAVGALVLKPIPGSRPLTCEIPFAAARVHRAQEPDYPDIAREQGATGSAIVHVDIDAFGRAIRTEIYQSAGNNALDVAAANAAIASSYYPALFACRPDSGATLFLADFTAQR